MAPLVALHPEENKTGLDTPLLDIVSQKEINQALEEAAEDLRFDRREIFTIISLTPYYRQILGGSLSGIILFLRSFQNKEPCLFAHEMSTEISIKMYGRVVNIFPEACTRQEGYSGCGHPELNGLILALVVGRLLIAKKYPHIKHIARATRESFSNLIEWDTTAYIEYRDAHTTGNERMYQAIRLNQQSIGSEAESECQELSNTLEQIYG